MERILAQQMELVCQKPLALCSREDDFLWKGGSWGKSRVRRDLRGPFQKLYEQPKQERMAALQSESRTTEVDTPEGETSDHVGEERLSF